MAEMLMGTWTDPQGKKHKVEIAVDEQGRMKTTGTGGDDMSIEEVVSGMEALTGDSRLPASAVKGALSEVNTGRPQAVGDGGLRLSNDDYSNGIGLMGDSNTAAYRGGVIAPFDPIFGYKSQEHKTQGWVSHALAFCGQRVNIVADHSRASTTVQYVEGETIPSFERQLDGIILSGVKSVAIMGGTNDISAGYTVESIAAAFGRILQRAEAAGIYVFLLTCLPSNQNAERFNKVVALNSWIKAQASQKSKSLMVVDVAPKLVQPSSNTVPPALVFGAFYDQIHIGNLGARIVGQEVAKALNARFPAVPHFPQYRVDNRSDNPGSNQLINNPIMSFGTAEMAAGYSVTKSAGVTAVTTTRIPDPDGIGDNVVMEWTSNTEEAAGFARLTSHNVGAMTQIGKSYYAMAEVVVEASNVAVRSLRLQLGSNANQAVNNTSDAQNADPATDPVAYPTPAPGQLITLRTPVITLEAAASTMNAALSVFTTAGVVANVKATVKKMTIFEVVA